MDPSKRLRTVPIIEAQSTLSRSDPLLGSSSSRSLLSSSRQTSKFTLSSIPTVLKINIFTLLSQVELRKMCAVSKQFSNLCFVNLLGRMGYGRLAYSFSIQLVGLTQYREVSTIVLTKLNIPDLTNIRITGWAHIRDRANVDILTVALHLSLTMTPVQRLSLLESLLKDNVVPTLSTWRNGFAFIDSNVFKRLLSYPNRPSPKILRDWAYCAGADKTIMDEIATLTPYRCPKELLGPVWEFLRMPESDFRNAQRLSYLCDEAFLRLILLPHNPMTDQLLRNAIALYRDMHFDIPSEMVFFTIFHAWDASVSFAHRVAVAIDLIQIGIPTTNLFSCVTETDIVIDDASELENAFCQLIAHTNRYPTMAEFITAITDSEFGVLVRNVSVFLKYIQEPPTQAVIAALEQLEHSDDDSSDDDEDGTIHTVKKPKETAIELVRQDIARRASSSSSSLSISSSSLTSILATYTHS